MRCDSVTLQSSRAMLEAATFNLLPPIRTASCIGCSRLNRRPLRQAVSSNGYSINAMGEEQMRYSPSEVSAPLPAWSSFSASPLLNSAHHDLEVETDIEVLVATR